MTYQYLASVSQSIPANGQVTLTYTDNSSGITGLVSRVLNIYDYDGNLLQTINMGATNTATYSISADGYYSFQNTTIDGSGEHENTTNFTSTSFYISVFAPAVAAIPTYCGNQTGQVLNLFNAQNNRYASLDMGTFGQGVISQNLITCANFLVETPYYATQ